MNQNFAVNCLNFFLPVPSFSLLLLAILKNQTAAEKSGGGIYLRAIAISLAAPCFRKRRTANQTVVIFFSFSSSSSGFRVKAPLESRREREAIANKNSKKKRKRRGKRRGEVLKTAVTAAMTVQSAKGPAPRRAKMVWEQLSGRRKRVENFNHFSPTY